MADKQIHLARRLCFDGRCAFARVHWFLKGLLSVAAFHPLRDKEEDAVMNKLGFGFLRLPRKGVSYDWQGISRMVDRFMELGGTYFDTCPTYLNGASDEGIRRCVAQRKPRESFVLANKLPGYDCAGAASCRRSLDASLKRCGVDYFDVYLLHWLNGTHYRIAQQHGQFEFLQRMKEEGLARRIGFSYHDNAALLERILDEHPEVDVVQLQVNYLDWDTAGIESRLCYEACVRHGKQVVVMEPLKGGTLTSIPTEARSALSAVHPDWSPTDWALRFVQSLPQVEVCLSGMTTLEEVEANCRPFDALDERETACLLDVRQAVAGKTAIPCTACGYCLPHCPQGIPIPTYFGMMNELERHPEEGWKVRPAYAQTCMDQPSPADCISCWSCEDHCPQRIKISSELRTIRRRLG